MSVGPTTGTLPGVVSRDESAPGAAKPMPALSLSDAIVVIVGIVVGAGIFKTPSLVASAVGSETAPSSSGSWGGAVSSSAPCYAELVTAYPHPGATITT